jgi:hypothetical protein
LRRCDNLLRIRVLQSWFDLLRREPMLPKAAKLLRFGLLQSSIDLLRQQHLLRAWGCLLQRQMLLQSP